MHIEDTGPTPAPKRLPLSRPFVASHQTDTSHTTTQTNSSMPSHWQERTIPRILSTEEAQIMSDHPQGHLINQLYLTNIPVPPELREAIGNNTVRVTIAFEADKTKGVISKIAVY